MVDRYDLYGRDDQGYRYDALQKQDPDGEWVEYSDYAALEQRVKELEAERDRLKDFRRGTIHNAWLTAPREKLVEALQFQGAMTKAFSEANDALCAENERLKENAESYSELVAQLHRDVAERDGEIKRALEGVE